MSYNMCTVFLSVETYEAWKLVSLSVSSESRISQKYCKLSSLVHKPEGLPTGRNIYGSYQSSTSIC